MRVRELQFGAKLSILVGERGIRIRRLPKRLKDQL
jgi:hypothetical protein